MAVRNMGGSWKGGKWTPEKAQEAVQEVPQSAASDKKALAAASNIGKKWGNEFVNVIQFSTGKFGYVGSVDPYLGYLDATPENIANGMSFGAKFGPKKHRVFDTEKEALDYAKTAGYKPLKPGQSPEDYEKAASTKTKKKS